MLRYENTMIIMLLVLSSCINSEKNLQEVLYVRVGNQHLYYENFVCDSTLIFPDTVFGRQLQACSDKIIMKQLTPVDTIWSKGIFLFKSTTSFSPTQTENSFFIGLKNSSGIKLYHAIDTNLLNRFLNCDVSLGMTISNWGMDTLVYMSFEISEYSSSPYFASEIRYQGIVWWEGSDYKTVFSLYPVSENFLHRDIIKGEYDEEVNGSPVIGTIDEHRSWSYQYFFEPEWLKLKLQSDEYYRDSDADSAFLKRKSIEKIEDNAAIIYKKIKRPFQTPRK